MVKLLQRKITPVIPKKPPVRLGTSSGLSSAPKKAAASPKGAFAKAQVEAKRMEMERSKPWDLSVPVGGSLKVYLLDKGEPFGRYEHLVGAGPTSRGRTLPCIKDSGQPCPVCAREGKEGYYVMYLSCVVPIEKYEKRDGTKVTRRFAKKLFPIKMKMAPKYQRIYEKFGTFRGLVLNLHRDGKMDPKTGSEVEVEKKLSEAQLQVYAKASDIKGEQGDQIRKAKIADAFDYTKVFPPVSGKELSAMIGQKSGSAVGDADFDDDGEGVSDDNWGVDD